MKSSRNTLLIASVWLSALVLGALVYLPGLPGAFVFDDISNIVNNPAIVQAIANVHDFIKVMLSAPVGGLLRPISTLTFMLDAHLFGVAPEPFKITNIAIHLAVGILLWFLARELLRAYRASTGEAWDDRLIAWLSLAASALWLVHPLNLTSVLYVVQRDSSLGALFTVAAVLSYMVGRRRSGSSGRLLIWLGTLAFMVIGMLCKENAALTSVYILVIEFTLLNFSDTRGSRSRETLGFFVVFLILPLLAAISFTAWKPGFFFSGYDGRGFTLYQRLISEPRVLLDYLSWMVVPDLRQLGLFHDDIKPSLGLLDPVSTLPCILAVLGLVVAGFILRRRAPLLSFGILWFFAGQLMESTVLPLELAFEHRNYLPIFGLILGGVGTLQIWANRQGQTGSAKVLLGLCILLFSLTTAMRAADWKNELTFARSESRHHPHSARALAELEWAYLNYVVSTKDERVIPLALDAAQASKAADPNSINQDVGVAYMYASLGKLPEAKLQLQAVAREVTLAAPSSTLQLALQTLLKMLNENSAPMFDDIGLVFRSAVQNPRLMSNPCYAADIWNTYGLFQRRTGDIPGALGSLHKGVGLCPSKVLVRLNFISLLLTYGDLHDAAPQLDALKDVHDLRYQELIAGLRQDYAKAAGHTDKK